MKWIKKNFTIWSVVLWKKRRSFSMNIILSDVFLFSPFFICVFFHAWVPFPSSFDDSLFFYSIAFIFYSFILVLVVFCVVEWLSCLCFLIVPQVSIQKFSVFHEMVEWGIKEEGTHNHTRNLRSSTMSGGRNWISIRKLFSPYFFLILKNTLEEEFCMFALYFARVLASSSSYRIHKVAFWHFMKRDYRTLVSKNFLVRLFSLSSTLKVNCKEEEREKFQNIQHLLICCPQQFLNSRKKRAEKTDNEQN